MRAEAFRQAAEQHGVHVEAEQFTAIAFGLVGKQVGDGADRLAQRGKQQVRRQRVDLIGHLLLAVQLIPVAVDPFQHAFQTLRRIAAHGLEARLIQLGAVHAASALHQVVRFVHQQADAPLVDQGEAV